ncbi:competence protein ComEC [Gammaproteobacteria bacterium]
MGLLLFVIILPVWWRLCLLRWVAGAATGFLWAWFYGYTMLAERLPTAWEGRDLVMEGRIASLPKVFESGTWFNLDSLTLTMDGETRSWPRRVYLSWYGASPLVVGERWRLTVRLKRPHGLMNPGGFDREGWLFHNGIRAQGAVRPYPQAARLDAGHWSYAVGRLRQELATAIAQARPDSPYLGLLQGLAIGETTTVTPEQWDTLVRTGTIHLLAISGSHIALIAGLAYFVVRHLWAWAGRAPLWLAAPRVGAMAAILAAIGYAALAGSPVPTQRAALMVTVAMGAVLVGRALRPVRTLNQALFAVLLWDPLAVTEAGFWLSFGAVALIFYGMMGRIGHPSHWRALGRVQWGMTVGLLPLLLALFQRVAVYSPLANLIAIPWLEVGTVPVVLVGTLLLPFAPILGGKLLTWADFSLAGLWPVLEFFSTLPWATWSPPAPPVWAVVIAMAGVLLLLAPRGLPSRWLGLIGIAPLFLLPAPRPPPGTLWLTILDVGQGLSIVVRTATHTLVYDTGPRYGPGHDLGAMVVAPFLRHEGVQRVDTLLVSHADSDHSGGTASLRAALPVTRLLGAIPNAEPCLRGVTWDWDGINFRVIHPSTENEFTGNNGSCVLRITWSGGALLLTGDISRAAEAQRVLNTPEDLRATVVVAPHHGSRSSSTPAFVAAVAPQVVIYSTGYHNRFGFPHPDVAARYAAAGVQPFNTAYQGAIELHLGPEEPLTVQSWREEARHYWHLPVPELGALENNKKRITVHFPPNSPPHPPAPFP